MRYWLILATIGVLGVSGCRRADSALNSELIAVLNDAAHYPRMPVTAVIDTNQSAGVDQNRFPVTLLDDVDIATEAGAVRGQAEDLLLLPDNSLLVADRRMPELMRLGPDRVLRPAVNELESNYLTREPVSIATVDATTVMVADRTTGLKLFETREGRLVPKSVVETGFELNDACSVGGRLLVRGLTPHGNTVSEYSKSGALLRTYAPAFEHPLELVVRYLSSGLIGCGRGLLNVAAFSHAFPFIHAYSYDGNLLWTTEIRGLKLARFEHRKRKSGPEGVRRDRGTVFDHPSTLMGIGDDKLLFQFVRVTQLSPEQQKTFEIHSVLLSSSSGQGSYLGTSLPLVREANLSRLYAVSPEGSSIKTYALNN